MPVPFTLKNMFRFRVANDAARCDFIFAVGRRNRLEGIYLSGGNGLFAKGFRRPLDSEFSFFLVAQRIVRSHAGSELKSKQVLSKFVSAKEVGIDFVVRSVWYGQEIINQENHLACLMRSCSSACLASFQEFKSPVRYLADCYLPRRADTFSLSVQIDNVVTVNIRTVFLKFSADMFNGLVSLGSEPTSGGRL